MVVRKTKSGRRKTAKRSRKRPSRRKSVWKGRRLWLIILAVLLLMLGYLVFLDFKIRHEFEGKRWAIPARIYARPLELYVGKPMSKAQLLHELDLLNYQRSNSPIQSGSYRFRSGELELVSRDFRFWDSSESSLRVRVGLENGLIHSLRDAQTGREIPLVRLDPAHIASFYPSHHEDRILVKLDQVPKRLVDGLLAVEDHRFYQHHGVSPLAIARALLANIKAAKTVQGGSTITQQLVKNFFLTNERSLIRKINEALMSLLLEWHYEKPEILQAYVNEVYLGQEGDRSINGFGLASHFYFRKPLSRLNTEQIALLVGLVKGPSYYNPRRQPERATRRRNLVLDLWQEQGLVDRNQAIRLKQMPLGVTPRIPRGLAKYPQFVDLVRRQLRRDYREQDLNTEGLQIYTTLDPWVQKKSEKGMVGQLEQIERQRHLKPGELQGAMVVTRVDSGEVVAIVGGRRPRYSGFNRALDAVRPIGSLIKPVVYLTALANAKDYNLATLIDDSPLSVELEGNRVWEPQNYDQQYHGQVPLYQALARSYNVATARLGLDIGIGAISDTLRALGIQRPIENYPSLVLGAVSLPPIEVTQIYQTLADGGFRTPLRSIRAVLDAHGEPLQRYPLDIEPVVDARATYLLNTALSYVVSDGTAKGLSAWFPAKATLAGKTGTTNELRDSWFAGFSDDYLGVVWLGLDNNEPMGLSGSSGALRVWGKVMGSLDVRPLSLIAPDGIEYHWVDPETGLLTEQGCKGAKQMPFEHNKLPMEGAPCKGKPLNWIRSLFK